MSPSSHRSGLFSLACGLCVLSMTVCLRVVPSPAAAATEVEESAVKPGAVAPDGKAVWAHWRGPEQNGVARDKDLPEKWSLDLETEGNNLLWSVPYGGRSTPLILNGRVYVINKCGEGATEQERVMCFHADTGKVLWEHKFNVFLTDIVSVRLGWTNLAGDPETGNVYAHGTGGLFFCFDKDGKVLWSRSLTEEYGRITGYGGRVTSPTVDGDLVILGMLCSGWGDQASGRNRFVAFDKRTGQVVWWSSTGVPVNDTYYSCPVVAVINGERLLISGSAAGPEGSGVFAFRVRTGELVWRYLFGKGSVNCSPVVDGNLVYIGHGDENEDNTQGRVICIDGSKVEKGQAKLVWKVDGIKAKYASPILYEGRLYVPDEVGKLYCLDAKDGKQLWTFRYGRNTKGSGVLADGKIYIAEVNSKFHILKPSADGCKAIDSKTFRKAGGGPDVEVNGSPAVVNGRVYFMTSNDLFCLTKKGQPTAPSADEIPTPPLEAATAPNAKPAHLQIYPAEVVLAPGESVELKARSFDDHGHFLGDAKVEWSLAGTRPPEGSPAPTAGQPVSSPPPPLNGELNNKSAATTKLTVSDKQLFQGARVVAKLGDLSAETRVRVVSTTLPIQPDFSKVPDGRPPSGWINAGAKFVVGQLPGGQKVLKKTANNPNAQVVMAYTYFGSPKLTNYTLEADVQGSKVRDDMPDVGIVAGRYELKLMGNAQKLHMLSWEPIPRLDKTLDWSWKPGVWYRMKLTFAVNGDKAVVRGKVWPRDNEEPKDWTLQFEDSTPNREGSPALYGNAAGTLDKQPGAEIFYDNVRVTPNDK